MSACHESGGRAFSNRTVGLVISCSVFLVVGTVNACFAQSGSEPKNDAELRLTSNLLSLHPNEKAKAITLLEGNRDLITDRLCSRVMLEAYNSEIRRDLQHSLILYEVASEAFRLMNQKAKLAQALSCVGGIHLAMGELHAAAGSYEESIRLSMEFGPVANTIHALGRLGAVYLHQGEYASAKRVSRKCLELAAPLGEDYGALPLEGKANALAILGNVSVFECDYAGGLQLLYESLRLSEDLVHRGLDWNRVLADRWTDIGWTYYQSGNHVESLNSYGKALQISLRIDYKNGLLLLNNRLGVLYLDQGDYAKAEELFGHNLHISLALDDKESTALALCNLGRTCERQARYDEAKGYLVRSLELSRATLSALVITILEELGAVCQAQGAYQLALSYYDQALESPPAAGDKVGRCEIIWRKADTYVAIRDYAKAIDLCDRALELAGANDPKSSYLARATRGEAYLRTGQYTLSEADLSEAIKEAELLRTSIGGQGVERAFFFQRRLKPYQLMAELLVLQGQPTQALAYSERTKGRTLLDSLESDRVNLNDLMGPDERQEDRRLNEQISSLNVQLLKQNQSKQEDSAVMTGLREQLAKLRLEYDSFLDRLYSAHLGLKTNGRRPDEFSARDAAPLFSDPNSVALEFLVGDQRTYVFAITKAAGAEVQVQEFTVSVPRDMLQKKVREFRDRIAAAGLGVDRLSADLFEILLGPARSALQGKSTIVLVPDGPLWELPFQALRARDGRYLIEDHSLFSVASLGVLKEMMNRGSASVPPSLTSAQGAAAQGHDGNMDLLLAFGNPTISTATAERAKMVHRDARLSPLPDAEREATTLRDLYGASNSRIFVAGAASKQNAERDMGHFRILHFATHGILDNDNPLYSQLILSVGGDDASQDGFLEAREIMGMNLKADLAVLSACDTARGAVTGGEGVIGMSWAFFVAGCPTMVVSQWSVESRSTTELMIEFHRNLRARNLNSDRIGGSAEALRQAALTMLRTKEYRHPFYWAGFVVMGDGW
jgi:CHAT domain-containing protein